MFNFFKNNDRGGNLSYCERFEGFKHITFFFNKNRFFQPKNKTFYAEFFFFKLKTSLFFSFTILFILTLAVLIKKILLVRGHNKTYPYSFINSQDFNFIFWFSIVFIFSFATSFFNKEAPTSSLFLILIFITVASTPIFYITSFKINFLNVLNSTKRKNKAELVWSDFITTISFFLRFFIQQIRIFLIVIVNFLLMEYLESFNHTLGLFESRNVFNFNTTYLDAFLATLRVFLECLDFFFIFFVQISAFFLVLFWLLSFLLLTQSKCVFEH